MQTIVAVFIGGGLGSVCRYLLSRSITGNFRNINPLGTFLSNLISTIILGIIIFWAASKFELNGTVKAMLVVGFCGGFSTFSTFSYETFELLRTGSYAYAVANIFVSVILGVGVLYLLSKSL